MPVPVPGQAGQVFVPGLVYEAHKCAEPLVAAVQRNAAYYTYQQVVGKANPHLRP